jgi:hypothetical protein
MRQQTIVRWMGLLVLLAGSALPVAQAQTASPDKQLAPGFTHLKTDDKLLLMPIDVELFSLSAGGVEEPRADWTAKAQVNMTQAIDARRQQARLQVIELKPEQADEFAEQAGLHAAVAQSIALHQFGGSQWALPSKQGRLDWSFGDAMRPLQAASGARYALFLWVRDSYASPERVAAMIALAALGIGITGGVQIGYASLVDLETGRVLWFNLLARAYGDLREPGPARESIDALLSGFPGVQ